MQYELSPEDIAKTINHNVWGVEYDKALFQRTQKTLIELISKEFGIDITLPNLYAMDALDFKYPNKFDYVVGNPPYIRIHNMPVAMRKKVKKYEHSTGTTDLYIIFYELGLKWLNKEGQLGYIAPNSWLRNSSQKLFRKHLVEGFYLHKIIDFETKQVFPNVTTYTCITYLNKMVDFSLSSQTMEFLMEGEKLKYKAQIPYSKLLKTAGSPLNFFSLQDYKFMKTIRSSQKRKYELSEICNTQNGLATLGDSMFLITKDELKEAITNNSAYENRVLRNVVKGSTYKGKPTGNKFIFPYTYDKKEEKFIGLTEYEIEEQYPNVYQYLLTNQPDLEARSLDKGSLWFWYGRSQAIQATDKRKLIIPPLIGPNQDKLNTYIVSAGTLVYSGLFITEIEGGTKLETLQSLLQTEEFAKYLKLTGKDMSGGYKSLNSKLISSYRPLILPEE